MNCFQYILIPFKHYSYTGSEVIQIDLIKNQVSILIISTLIPFFS